jgi:sporulation protein YlmC with PRC-barrel domain
MTETEGMTETGAPVAPAEGMTTTEAATGTAGAAGAAAGAAMTETEGLQTAEAIETYGVVRASELMDFDVENTANEDLGDVDDAFVTLPDGCLKYVLVSSGGILGLGEDQFLVPWRAVALNLEDGRLVLNVDQSVFDTAPIFDGNNVPDMTDPNWDADVSGFWNSVNIAPPATDAPEGELPDEATATMTETLEADAAAAAAATGAMTDTAAVVPGAMDATAQDLQEQDEVLVRANPCDMSMTGTGADGAAGADAGSSDTMTGTTDAGSSAAMTDTAQAGAEGDAEEGATIEMQVPQIVRLSELMDFGVRNSEGEDLGSLEDIVVDWQQSRLAYPILSFGGFLGLGDKWFVIPFDAVTLNPLDQAFIFDVQPETLENAPGFDPDQLPDTTDPDWDSDVRGFWNMGDTEGADTQGLDDAGEGAGTGD